MTADDGLRFRIANRIAAWNAIEHSYSPITDNVERDIIVAALRSHSALERDWHDLHALAFKHAVTVTGDQPTADEIAKRIADELAPQVADQRCQR